MSTTIFMNERSWPEKNISIYPLDSCKENKYVMNQSIDYMLSNFEAYTYHKLDTLYLTKMMRTELLPVLYT